MAYYSFKVRSTGNVIIPECITCLGKGIDVFNAEIFASDLDNFCKSLINKGVSILEIMQLDEIISEAEYEIIKSAIIMWVTVDPLLLKEVLS
jgi:hypothetical protein